ncbi:MAG: TonB-dependent receptor [Vulcanimicrobiaceae bacterium]
MSRFLAALSAAVMLFIVIPAAPAFASSDGLVRGTVTLHGKPVSGAIVRLLGEGQAFTVQTDAHGVFTVSRVPFGHYRLNATSDGAASHILVVNVTSGSVAHVNISLSKLKTIANTVVYTAAQPSGNPVAVNRIGRKQLATLPVNNSLNRVLETVPGIVRFSYNEPVAHGFHGVTYEIDGAPMPLATSSNFAEIIDPRNIDSIEVYTGAMPAEYGGSRAGAVINIITDRYGDVHRPYSGDVTAGIGNYGQQESSFNQRLKIGKTDVFFNMNAQRSLHGIQAPTFNPIHDATSQSDQFFRTASNLGHGRSLSFDYSNSFSTFQIPINIDPNNPNDPVFSTPGTDDVQLEYDRFGNFNYSAVSKKGNAVFQVIPWFRTARINYMGDLGQDVLGMQPNPNTPNGLPFIHQIGLVNNQNANYIGLRVSQFLATHHNAFKAGFELTRENYIGFQQFAQYQLPTVSTGVTQAGAQVGAYVQDSWSPTHKLTVDYGLRYDHSTGFTGGNAVSPRIGVNLAVDSKNIMHAYYGRFYAAPDLQDVRQACVLLQGCPTVPVYDLKPETDSYYEVGLAHMFSPLIRGYANYWVRNAYNVLDTTQLLDTPLFAVYNNAIGKAEGIDVRLAGHNVSNTASWFLSSSIAQSLAGGISGSTFLFSPGSFTNQLQYEDHDQTVALTSAYTRHFGVGNHFYSTLQANYGTGFPVQFQNGNGRLPTHLTFDFSLGRAAGRGKDRSLGFSLDVQNILNHQYVIKLANGFNTTQIASARSILFRVTAPF